MTHRTAGATRPRHAARRRGKVRAVKRPLLILLALLISGACQRKAADDEEPPRPTDRIPGTDPPTALERRLEAEFAAAYASEATPNGRVIEADLEAAPVDLALLDGRTLSVWAYNGTVPGPTLRVSLGETLRVRFRNRLPQPTTIHWHGVRVPNAMDGVPGVTQPPIEPGGEFVYEFTPKDAGTFWFHPHVRGSEQVERGLYGILVVDDAKPPPYTRDEVWVLDDWRLTREGDRIDPRFNTRGDLAHDGRWGQHITVNGSSDHMLDVSAGERIRLRLAVTANGRVFKPDFGQLDAQVIAVDGMYAQAPMAASDWELAPGNRLDLDITVPESLRGQTIEIVDRFTRRPFPIASIRVADAVVDTPSFTSPARAHVPQWAEGVDAPVRATFALNARRGGELGIEWTINDRTYAEFRGELLPLDRWSKIRFENRSARIHPMHIHGQFFKVLARNGVDAREPYWRDTVLLHPRETIDIGLIPLDWGKWMLHCHILEHAEAGMMTIVEVPEPP